MPSLGHLNRSERWSVNSESTQGSPVSWLSQAVSTRTAEIRVGADEVVWEGAGDLVVETLVVVVEVFTLVASEAREMVSVLSPEDLETSVLTRKAEAEPGVVWDVEDTLSKRDSSGVKSSAHSNSRPHVPALKSHQLLKTTKGSRIQKRPLRLLPKQTRSEELTLRAGTTPSQWSPSPEATTRSLESSLSRGEKTLPLPKIGASFLR